MKQLRFWPPRGLEELEIPRSPRVSADPREFSVPGGPAAFLSALGIADGVQLSLWQLLPCTAQGHFGTSCSPFPPREVGDSRGGSPVAAYPSPQRTRRDAEQGT